MYVDDVDGGCKQDFPVDGRFLLSLGHNTPYLRRLVRFLVPLTMQVAYLYSCAASFSPAGFFATRILRVAGVLNLED